MIFMTCLINVRFILLSLLASRRSLATCKRLGRRNRTTFTPTEEFKSTSLTLTCTSSNNYAYLYRHNAVCVRKGRSSGRSRSHASFHEPFTLLLK